MTGEFFSIHHGKMKGWRANPNPTYDIHRILGHFNISKEIITKEYIKNLTYLEAGGSGNKARGMSRAGCDNVHYIDLSKDNTNFVLDESNSTKFKVNVKNGSLLDKHDDYQTKFDLIHCGGVIHHTDNPASALLNISKWLKPNGKLLINCYQSGTLYFFWVEFVRQILSLVNFNYYTLHDKMIEDNENFAQLMFNKYHFLDHALVPIIKPTSDKIFEHDLQKLGFNLLYAEKGNGSICHQRYKMEMVYAAVKKESCNIELSDLLYQDGIDQFSLEYNHEIKNLIQKFYSFKESIKNNKNIENEVIKVLNTINNIWVDSRNWEIPFNTFRIYGVRHTVKTIIKGLRFRLKNAFGNPSIELKSLFMKPEKYFYNNLDKYFDSI